MKRRRTLTKRERKALSLTLKLCTACAKPNAGKALMCVWCDAAL
jgi:hypothetical protein